MACFSLKEIEDSMAELIRVRPNREITYYYDVPLKETKEFWFSKQGISEKLRLVKEWEHTFSLQYKKVHNGYTFVIKFHYGFSIFDPSGN